MMRSDEIKALRGKLTARYPGEPTQKFQPLTDRIRRALSWMDKAYHSRRDSPIRFIELWIALNALYGQRPSSDPDDKLTESTAFAQWVRTIAKLDTEGALLASLDGSDVKSLMENQFLCRAYWDGDPSYVKAIKKDMTKMREALRERRMADALVYVFHRILVLRNQLVHGSAAENTERNQDAVQPAIRVLWVVLRVAVHLMIEKGPSATWTPVYPALGTPRHPWPQRESDEPA